MGKKCVAGVVLFAMLVSLLSVPVGKKKAAADEAGQTAQAQSEQTQTVTEWKDLTGDELIEDMGAGWNLGNTMDGHTGFTPGEMLWQNVKTTKELIRSVHDMGFNTVRVPVTWGTMIDDENGYAIDEKWMGRVQDIVDYCISQDMYVIVNIHHDGAEQTGWLRIATKKKKALKKKFAGVWKNIANTFKDYDEHLILESMNEVRGVGNARQDNKEIMKLNQIFVDTVRATGSCNAKRWLLVPGQYNMISPVCNSYNKFKLPKDSIKNRLIVSVHDYSPWSFCGSESTQEKKCSAKMLKSNDNELKPLYDKYTSKGIPVVVGEYGCINKDNAKQRAYYLEGMNRLFRKYKLVGVYWDQGWYDRSRKPDYSFTIIDRETCKPVDKKVTDGLLRGRFGLDGKQSVAKMKKASAAIPVSSLQPSQTQLALKVGEEMKLTASYEPANANDVLLWKTSDETVATVSYGKVEAKGIGQATITLFSQNSAVSTEIAVTVTAQEVAVPSTGITVAQDSYALEEESTAWLQTVLAPAGHTDFVHYKSSNDAVATVSTVGKILAIAPGSAVITVETSSGLRKEVTVTVLKKEVKQELELALNVYYNDSTHSYFSNEEGSEVISLKENGQYTLSFDCNKDLSDKAKKAGVKNLQNLTAIYIKDHRVTAGDAKVSPLKSCEIRYDKVEVDGKELTITKKDFKSALKDSGIFDTNDPINAWDGSAVSEVVSSGGSASFSGIKNPKKITVTFTLQNLVFE